MALAGSRERAHTAIVQIDVVVTLLADSFFSLRDEEPSSYSSSSYLGSSGRGGPEEADDDFTKRQEDSAPQGAGALWPERCDHR